MGLATSTVKHLLLLLNFIFTVFGLILMGFGIFILVSANENVVDHGENVAGGLIIALGALTVIISIFGCLAAIHESRNKLIVYIVTLIVLILLQLMLIASASLGSKDGLTGSIEEGFDELWESEKVQPGALAYYEKWLHCCGVNNTQDYFNIHHEIPKSCCITYNCATTTLSNVYTDGCQAKFEEYLSGKLIIFSVICWILVIAEIIGAVLGWLLFRSLKNQSRRSNVGWM